MVKNTVFKEWLKWNESCPYDDKNETDGAPIDGMSYVQFAFLFLNLHLCFAQPAF